MALDEAERLYSISTASGVAGQSITDILISNLFAH
jgi:hypothetical protein